MPRVKSVLAAALVTLLPSADPARASFHFWDIVEVYSNDDGSIQFIEFYTTFSHENFLEGETLDTLTSPLPYTFPNDLGPGTTQDKFFLVATPDFSCVNRNGPVLPDYVLPTPLFFNLSTDTIDFADGFDVFSFGLGELPTDGVNSLHENFGSSSRTTAINSPTNFAGETCVLPEPGLASLLAGATLLAALGCRR